MARIKGLKGGKTNITVSYGGKSATFSNFTVNKKTVTITVPTLKSVSPYTGSEQVLINEGSCTTGGTMYYYVSTSSSTPTFSVNKWTTTAPSKTDAGKYYLWYYVYVSDTDAYTGTGINTVTKVGSGSVTIPKQTGSSGTSLINPSTTFSKSSQTVQLGVDGATGEVTYSTSITVKKGGNNITGWKCTSAGVVTIPASAAVGTYTVSGSITVAESTNYNAVSATSRSWTVTINKAAGYGGTANNPSTTFSTSSQTVQLKITGATGAVTYPTSIKIMKGGIGISNKGWSCTSAGVLTIPASTAVATYRVEGWISVASSANYDSTSERKIWTVTIDKAEIPITITPTTATIYVHSSHTYNNTVQLSVSGAQGSVTYSSSATGKATVDSSGLVTAVSEGTATITATAAGNENYNSGTATCTVTIVTDTISSYGSVTGAISISQIKDFPASGVTLTTSNISEYFSHTKPCAQTITWESGYTNSGSISYSWSVSSGTVASKGTTISNTSTVEISATVKATGEGNKTASKSVTSGTQAGNYVTAITPKSSSNTDATHFSYANIGAGATSASPSMKGGALYTFSSGSTNFDATTSPSFGGSATYTRSYTLASSQNGFTAVNSSTGVLTATSRGKTPGAARASANVTGTLVVKYTHTSTYSAGGTVTSSTKSNTQTCTQNANYLTWGDPELTVSSPATPYSMTVSGETKAITASATQSATYSSGATDTYTPTISYTVKTAKSGYSLSSNSVTVTNNTSTSARNGFVVTVTATGKTGTNSTYESGYNKTATSDRTFNQAAGVKVYGTPTVTFTYTNTAASGVTDKTPTTVTYSQPWTWNGVSGSGGNVTSGLTLSYSTTGTLPTGLSKGTNFATTGAITWASRGTIVGSQLNANSNIVLSIPFADKTRTYNPTGCTQGENALTGISISLGSSSIKYNATTSATVTATYTSGSSKDVTSSLSTSSSATSNYIKSGDTSVVTVS